MTRILITGSNSGFGRLTALTLGRAGHQVVATMRDLDRGAALLADAATEGLDIELAELDVCDPLSVEAALADPGSIDAVVNNAGFEVRGAVELVGDDLLWSQFDTNVLGPLRVIRSVLPTWRERGSGTIVNISSVGGMLGTPFAGVYAASKWAIEALSEALHFEVSDLGVRVRLVQPGRFPTDLHSNMVYPDGWDDSVYPELETRFRDALATLDGDGPKPDPQQVADAIAAAATDPDAPFRTVVGADAELISSVKPTMSFEDFDAAMRATLGWKS